jgi:hypothetical protein
MPLSLLVPYRRRPDHLRVLLDWVARPDWTGIDGSALEVVVVECDDAPSTCADLCRAAGARYAFCRGDGVFHKTRALNLALEHARGTVVAAVDVDLVPRPGVLALQWDVVRAQDCLAGGYRVMAPSCARLQDVLSLARKDLEVAPEDAPSALLKQLIDGERMVIAPMCRRALLERIGGWDENYLGWGAEDQELIERTEREGTLVLRSPSFLYFHLSHTPDADWREPVHAERNRRYYYAAREIRTRATPERETAPR